jgi:rubrerythrin
MTAGEALKLALSKEVSAIKIYGKLAIEHPAISELLTTLMNEEEKHKKLIEQKIAEMNR